MNGDTVLRRRDRRRANAANFRSHGHQANGGYTITERISSTERVMQVSRWGNSLAIRLPAAIVEVLELKEGDDIEIVVSGARTFGVKRAAGPRDILARLRKFRGRLPADFSFDRLEANERR